ncbi:MAG: hypothetical protein ACTH2Q_02980 [Propionibacteriaceae bacterium]
MSDRHTEPSATQDRDPMAPQPHPPLAPYTSLPGYGNSQPPLASGSHRAVAAVAGVLLGGLLFVTAGLMTGAVTLRLQRFDFSLATTLPLVGLTLLSMAVVVGLAITARFSSAGLYLAGAGQLLGAIVHMAAPSILYEIITYLGPLMRGIDFYLIGGGPILVGTAFIASGVVATGLRRKARANGPTPAAFR